MTQEYIETSKAFLDHFNELVEAIKRIHMGKTLPSGSYLVNVKKYQTLSDAEWDKLKEEIAAMTSWPDKAKVTIKKGEPYEHEYKVLIEHIF